VPTVWETGTTGPWLCDDSEVLCDGEEYLGPVYPWLDGGLFNPIDITYVRASYDPVAERASFAFNITPQASYLGVYVSPTYSPTVAPQANHSPSVPKSAGYRPTYEKIGTP
jgi:hypothetical protein